MKKKITVGVIIVIGVASLALNFYWFGYQALQADRVKYLNSGNIQTRDAVIKGIQDKGEVLIIDSKGVSMTLIQKPVK